MGDFAIAACCEDGCAILTNKISTQNHEEEAEFINDDPLIEKVIQSKLKIKNQECEIKSPADNFNIVIIAYGSYDERKKIFKEIKDEMRSYLLSFYRVIPLQVLAFRIGYFVKNHKFGQIDVILASWTSLNGCELYKIDSYGENFKCFGCSIGYNSKNITNKLLNFNFKNTKCHQMLRKLTKLAVKSTEHVENIQLSSICEATVGKHQICENEVIEDIINCASD